MNEIKNENIKNENEGMQLKDITIAVVTKITDAIMTVLFWEIRLFRQQTKLKII